MTFTIRPLTDSDRSRVRLWTIEHWGAETVVSRGLAHRPVELPGFVAEEDGAWVGLATFRPDGGRCELVTLDSVRENRGIGSALIRACVEAAQGAGCLELWLVTTNDNARGIRFYQRRGFDLVALHHGAVDEARRSLKPEIPLLGEGIPIRHELEFVLRLTPVPGP